MGERDLNPGGLGWLLRILQVLPLQCKLERYLSVSNWIQTKDKVTQPQFVNGNGTVVRDEPKGYCQNLTKYLVHVRVNDCIDDKYCQWVGQNMPDVWTFIP